MSQSNNPASEPVKIKRDPTKSIYGDRDTIGKTYRDLQLSGDKSPIECGNMTEEVCKGLVDDLNEAILSKPFGPDKEFYIQIYEWKDLQMKSAIHREINKFAFRPWPENDTIVFRHDPKAFVTFFCWCLPHWSEMDNILANHWLYDKELVKTIKNWKNYRLEEFGFIKNLEGHYEANLLWKDKPIEEYKHKSSVYS